MYFKQFPSIYYDFIIGGEVHKKVVKDITLNIRVIKSVLDNVTVYEHYMMKDGETPEIVAERVYGNPLLHWTIMIVNEKYDYVNDFPISGPILEDLVNSKYGSTHRDDQHILFGRPHFEDGSGNVVDADYPNAISITNFDYEFMVNESKRSIKIVDPALIDVFVADIQSAFRSNV